MKKTYIEPQVEELIIAENEMICTSIAIEGTTSENSITSGDSRLIFEDDDFLDD